MSEALPLPLLIDWAADRAEIPKWAKHAIHRGRKGVPAQ